MLFTRWILVLALAGGCPLVSQGQAVTLIPRITTVAGNGVNGHSGDGGSATAAAIDIEGAVVLDHAGNLYLAEQRQGYVRKVDTRGVITTVAGSGQGGQSGDGGPATSASILADALAIDGAGQLFIGGQGRVRQVDTQGIITTVAGHGATGNSGDGGSALDAQFQNVSGLALDGAGNLFIVDWTWDVIRKVDALGIISTWAGNYALSCPGPGCTYPFGGDGGPATNAALTQPSGLTADPAGSIYFYDALVCAPSPHCLGPARIRKVDAQGIITSVAGNGTWGYSGDGGPATAAAIAPAGNGDTDGVLYASVATDRLGNLYISDSNNRRIRRVDTLGIITTVAGNGSQGFSGDGGPAVAAQLDTPGGIAVDDAGNLFFRDGGRIRKVSTATAVDFGTVPIGQSSTQSVPLSINSTLALAGVQASGDFGVVGNSCPMSASLAAGTLCTLQVTFTPSRGGLRSFDLVVTDGNGYGYHFQLQGTGTGSVLAFTPGVLSTVAGTGQPGFGGDGGPATNALLNAPAGIRVDGAGNLFVADSQSCRIRKVDRAGIITTVAGNGVCSFSGDGRPSGDGGPATSAALGAPAGMASDASGNLFIGDFDNHRVRKVDTRGFISTVAGTGTPGFSGDGGPATQAQFHYPVDLAFDALGNLFIADENNERIRKVNPAGTISTVAGSGSGVSGGDGGAATSAGFWALVGVATDPAGNFYVPEYYGQRVRKVDAAGAISTFAGTGLYGGTSVSDNVPATAAPVANPTGVAADGLGNIYIANYGGNHIDKVDAAGVLTNVAGNGSAGFSPDGSPATGSPMDYPWGVAPDGFGNFYFSEIYGHRVRKVDVTAGALSFAAPQTVGTRSAPQNLRLTNAGNAALGFTGFAFPSNFEPAVVGNDCTTGLALAPGASCNLGVVFAPHAAGSPSTGTLLVFDSALNSPQSVTLSGTASPAPPAATVLDVRVLFGGQSYSLPTSTRNRLPWQISAVQVVFSAPVATGDAASLAGLTATGLGGLGTATLTWSIAPQPVADVTAALVTSGAHALADAFGTPVAAFSTRLRLLCGDANDDGFVSSADMVAVGNARSAPYNLFDDLNGDGVVDVKDVQIVRTRIGATLP